MSELPGGLIFMSLRRYYGSENEGDYDWCKRDYFVMYTLSNSKPVKGLKCGSNVGMFRGADDSAGKCILNLLKAFNLRESPW